MGLKSKHIHCIKFILYSNWACHLRIDFRLRLRLNLFDPNYEKLQK